MPKTTAASCPVASPPALERARRKAYLRLIPLLGVCYIVAYVDRANVSLAKLTMSQALPGFDNGVVGLGAGLFFVGYFLLEIPGAILVERWSARKWIGRIMISWGVIAALTAWVRTPREFYLLRFLLGLAEAGFFPGVIVYLTHWFSSRDRSRALACFIIATPIAQIISPKISSALLQTGTSEMVNGVLVHHPAWFGLQGWQAMYVFWGIPAVLLGVVVWVALKDRPADAHWLSLEERRALEQHLAADPARHHARRMGISQGLRHPKVLLLAAAYFCGTAANYGYEFFLPSILQRWYSLRIEAIASLIVLPPLIAMAAQLVAGWSSDRTGERRLHVMVPLLIGAGALTLAPFTRGHLALTIFCFMIAFSGIKSYQPAFWSLPGLVLTEAGAAAGIGLINSVGNLGGFVGPSLFGKLETASGSFIGGIYCLAGCLVISALLIWRLGLGRQERKP